MSHDLRFTRVICASAGSGPSSSARRPASCTATATCSGSSIPPRRLVLTTTETRLDGSSFDTQLEFVFEEAEGKTLMTMLQRGFSSLELREEHLRGVPNAFARLERAVLTPTDRGPGG